MKASVPQLAPSRMSKIVLRGDARFHFGEVREAMVAVEEAGFGGVGLIAKRAGEAGGDEVMQFQPEGDSGLQSEINITPLVDVVLVLLIIFMVVVPLLLKGYDVGIPPSVRRDSAGRSRNIAGRPEHRVQGLPDPRAAGGGGLPPTVG